MFLLFHLFQHSFCSNNWRCGKTLHTIWLVSVWWLLFYWMYVEVAVIQVVKYGWDISSRRTTMCRCNKYRGLSSQKHVQQLFRLMSHHSTPFTHRGIVGTAVSCPPRAMISRHTQLGSIPVRLAGKPVRVAEGFLTHCPHPLARQHLRPTNPHRFRVWR